MHSFSEFLNIWFTDLADSIKNNKSNSSEERLDLSAIVSRFFFFYWHWCLVDYLGSVEVCIWLSWEDFKFEGQTKALMQLSCIAFTIFCLLNVLYFSMFNNCNKKNLFILTPSNRPHSLVTKPVFWMWDICLYLSRGLSAWANAEVRLYVLLIAILKVSFLLCDRNSSILFRKKKICNITSYNIRTHRQWLQRWHNHWPRERKT